MVIKIDPKKCRGCELCVETCPGVFRAWGEHLRSRIEVEKAGPLLAAIRQAIKSCPAQAIVLMDQPDGKRT